MFPFVFIITFLFLTIAFLTSKLQNDSTHLLVSLYSALGPIETGAIILSTIIFFVNQHEEVTINILFITALGVLFLINLIGYVVQTPYLLSDRKFLKWTNRRSKKQESRWNLVVFHFVSLISLFSNYKLKMILFSRLFNFQCFKFQLETVEKFKAFNVLSFIGYLPQILSLYCCISAIAYSNLGSQELLIFIDCLITVVLNMVFSLVIIKKEAHFFQEKLDGVAINKVFNLIEEINSATAMTEISQREKRKQKKKFHLQDISQLDEFAYTSTKRERNANYRAFKTHKIEKDNNEESLPQDDNNTNKQMPSQIQKEYQKNQPKSVLQLVSGQNLQQQQNTHKNILNFDEYYEKESLEELPSNHIQQIASHPISNQQPLVLNQQLGGRHYQSPKEPNHIKNEQINITKQQKNTHTKLSDYLMSLKNQNNQSPQIAQKNIENYQNPIDSERRQANSPQQKFRILINESALIDSEPSNRMTSYHQQHLNVIDRLYEQQEAKKIVKRVISAHSSPKKIIHAQNQINNIRPIFLANTLSINQEHDEKPIKNKSVQKVKRQENHPINSPPTEHPIYGQRLSNRQQEEDSDLHLTSGKRSRAQTKPQITEEYQTSKRAVQVIGLLQNEQVDSQIPHPKFYESSALQDEYAASSFKRSHPQSLAQFSKQKFKNQIAENSSSNNIPRRPIQVKVPSTDEDNNSTESQFILKRNFDRAIKFSSQKPQRPRTSKQTQRFRKFSLQKKQSRGIQGKKMLSLQKIYLQRLANF